MVYTDDPGNKKIYLVISGTVKDIIKVAPRTVSLSGAPGQTLSAVVNIEAVEGNELNILDIRQKFNKQIKSELVRPVKGEKKWQVKISCHSDQPADLYDFITLKTDNPDKPLLKIRVYAIYDRVTGSGASGS